MMMNEFQKGRVAKIYIAKVGAGIHCDNMKRKA